MQDLLKILVPFASVWRALLSETTSIIHILLLQTLVLLFIVFNIKLCTYQCMSVK